MLHSWKTAITVGWIPLAATTTSISNGHTKHKWSGPLLEILQPKIAKWQQLKPIQRPIYLSLFFFFLPHNVCKSQSTPAPPVKRHTLSHTKLVYKPASHEVSLFFIGCSHSVPAAVRPCNAISQLLHFCTVRVLQYSSQGVFFLPERLFKAPGAA